MKIFVGSTVKDLRDLRNELKRKISDWGHTPLLSESKNFPIFRHKDSKTNCICVVEECDLFLLILDTRAGIIYDGLAEPKFSRFSGISITEAEYRRARERDIPICILIRENTMNESSLYRKEKKQNNLLGSKKTSHSWHADIEVFEFIDRLQHEENIPWIHRFSNAGDVIEYVYPLIKELEKIQEENTSPFNQSKETLTVKFDNYQRKLDQLKTTIDNFLIMEIWKFFASQRLTGKYNLEETLHLLNEIKAPFPFLESENMKDVKPDSDLYMAMARLLDHIRDQIAEKKYTDGMEIFNPKNGFYNENFQFATGYQHYLGYLWGLVGEQDITSSQLQHYFYSNKKESDKEKVEDTIVNLIILFMMAYSMWRWAEFTHGEMLDAIIANESPWKGEGE